MHILLADAILQNNTILHDHGVVFDKTILEISPNDDLRSHYGDQCIELGIGSVLLPGLINPHVHLEFSANRSTLTYGGFMPWLSSVMANRDDLINDCDDECITQTIDTMLSQGITAFGAVSSYGYDLAPCFNAPQKVVYFNELIGSDPKMADALYGNFQERLFASQGNQREGFYPSIAIHSPYSVHRVLIQKAVAYAKAHTLRLTAHFMESPSEREWLDENGGDFKPFFENFLKQHQAANTAEDFLQLFHDIPTLFTHVVHTKENELALLKQGNHTIIHCPISNRLLGNGAIDLEKIHSQTIRWVCGTDGLSSNYALDLFEEMKIALFMHHSHDLLTLAYQLWNSVTVNAAQALNLNCGKIAPNYDADILVARVDYPINEQLAIHLLLQPRVIESVYIQGQKVKGNQ
ncbi:MAG TPA: aminofutalosine deaminase family hydrolase [Sulfuricurvum sp.]|nr:MAG: chlorohydrolase [Campylobacterales bacterium 16-40-21]OZA03019.1 MAG: chlorohydrolase [Sulfuricurvum sp. 17-40-25]HQS66898.1 aminofutalosine deaminase family hydrolase [Sulfuricurvum sp.]HQT35636.1 aminofutalosine deaminase family hydrolase [Sulfuricurvum sp.]